MSKHTIIITLIFYLDNLSIKNNKKICVVKGGGHLSYDIQWFVIQIAKILLLHVSWVAPFWFPMNKLSNRIELLLERIYNNSLKDFTNHHQLYNLYYIMRVIKQHVNSWWAVWVNIDTELCCGPLPLNCRLSVVFFYGWIIFHHSALRWYNLKYLFKPILFSINSFPCNLQIKMAKLSLE